MYVLLSCLSFLFRAMPLQVTHGLGAFLGWFWYYVVPIRRGVVKSNLRLAFPHKSESEIRRCARRTYVQLARCAVEFLRLPGLTRARADRLIDYDGLEHLEQAQKLGKGVVVATAHFGNFDLLACSQALRGIPLHIVSREQSASGVNRFWMSTRSRTGLGLLPAKGSVMRIHRLLKTGQVLGLVIDQHMPEGRGIAVPFFGRLASTTHAPALLALTNGAPLLCATIERLPGGRHLVVIEPALNTAPGADRQEDIRRLTGELNGWLEERIRQRPDHWLWLHRRWKLPH